MRAPRTFRDPLSTQQLQLRRKAYHYQWQPVCTGSFEEATVCLESTLCPCCSIYDQRLRALGYDLSSYVCCDGACPCSGRMGEQELERADQCLRYEALCCGCYAAMATRWMLQDQVQLRNAWPDECMAGTTLCLRGCLAGLGCDASNIEGPAEGRGRCIGRVLECLLLDVIAGPLLCCVYPWMAMQVNAVLALRESNPHIVQPPYDPTEAPSMPVIRQRMASGVDGPERLGSPTEIF